MDEVAGDPVEPVDERAVVKIAFEETAYVDATLSTGRIVERVRHQTESIFTALRKADLTPVRAGAQPIDVPFGRLKREPVTVVDPATGASRSALRIRYRYVALAQIPKAHAALDALRLGVLHTADGPQTEAILTECTANGERERLAATELWTVFDASLPGCVQAMATEHAAIEAARRGLQHPEREIVALELGRVYMPVTVHVHGWGPSVAREPSGERPPASDPTPRAHTDMKIRAPPGVPGAPAAPAEGPIDPLAMWESKENEKDYEADPEEDDELRRANRALMASGAAAAPAPPQEYYGSYKFLAPNYALLYVAIIAAIVLLVGKSRQRSRR
jgi:hypothetical protein